MTPTRDQIAAFLREQTEADHCGASNEYAEGYRLMARFFIAPTGTAVFHADVAPDLLRGAADMLTHLAHFAETGLRPDEDGP